MTQYVIFGAGRVGQNMAAYLESFGHEVTLISRAQAMDYSKCEKLVKAADIIAAAVPDSKLQAWWDEWRASVGEKTCIHFSGAVTIAGMASFHPLYSFPKTTLTTKTMKGVAFACPADGPSFADVFPDAPNPNFKITDAARAHYHALAVLSGNLVSYIWNETAKEFAGFSGMPPEKLLVSYFTSIVERFIENPTASLTGPIARHDAVTVKENLSALAGNEKLRSLYKAFLVAAWPEFDESNKSD